MAAALLVVLAGETAVTSASTTKGKGATPFRSFRDFAGNYVGSYDGRPASMTITVTRVVNSDRLSASIVFVDAGGTRWLTRVSAGQTFSAQDHVIRGMILNRSGSLGQVAVEWPALFIHTHNIRYLSGFSHWQGQDYGMSWTRK